MVLLKELPVIWFKLSWTCSQIPLLVGPLYCASRHVLIHCMHTWTCEILLWYELRMQCIVIIYSLFGLWLLFIHIYIFNAFLFYSYLWSHITFRIWQLESANVPQTSESNWTVCARNLWTFRLMYQHSNNVSINPSVHLPVYPSSINQAIHSPTTHSIHPSTSPAIHPPTRLPHPFTHPHLYFPPIPKFSFLYIVECTVQHVFGEVYCTWWWHCCTHLDVLRRVKCLVGASVGDFSAVCEGDKDWFMVPLLPLAL